MAILRVAYTQNTPPENRRRVLHKRVFKVFNFAFKDGGNVKANGDLFADRRDVVICDLSIPSLFLARDRLDGKPEAIARARLDFYKADKAVLFRNDIRFAERRSIVALKNLIAVLL